MLEIYWNNNNVYNPKSQPEAKWFEMKTQSIKANPKKNARIQGKERNSSEICPYILSTVGHSSGEGSWGGVIISTEGEETHHKWSVR